MIYWAAKTLKPSSCSAWRISKKELQMAYTREYTEIAGVMIKIADGTLGGGIVGDSQTVNVYDESNTEGNYRQVYRSRDRDHWVRADTLHRTIRTPFFY
jgi:hypothetical protein